MWGSLSHHLSALRARLGLVVAALMALWLLGWMVHPQLMDWLVGPWCGDQPLGGAPVYPSTDGALLTLTAPACGLTAFTLTGGLWARMWVASLPVGVAGIPIAVWQGWWFCVGDDLATNPDQSVRRRWRRVGWGALGLWTAAIGCTAVVAHPVLTLMVRLGEPWVLPLVTIDGVLSAIVALFLAIVALLLMPLGVGIALAIRLITPAHLSNQRRLVVMGALILAAILTPTTDPITMGVVALCPILSVEIVRLGAIASLALRGDRSHQ